MSAPTMAGLRPGWGRVTVLPSPVDEIQRESGMIVPIGLPSSADSEEASCERGIVLHVAQAGLPAGFELGEGDVVYYIDGDRIGDVVVVWHANVLAFMEDR